MRTVPLGGNSLETSRTVSTKELFPKDVAMIRRLHPFEGSLYCWFQFANREPESAIFQVDVAAKKAERLAEASRIRDFCIVPEGPRLAYLCADFSDPPDSPSSATQHGYTLTTLPLREGTEKPATAKLNAGKIWFYGGLQYDVKDHSFVIRGNIPPYDPLNRFHYRIRLTGPSN